MKNKVSIEEPKKEIDIIMKKVKSSNIGAIGYDEANEKLRITFLSGKTYDYTPVSTPLYKELMAADSKGSFFYQRIKSDENIGFQLYELKSKK